jgi:hypothetical protein
MADAAGVPLVDGVEAAKGRATGRAGENDRSRVSSGRDSGPRRAARRARELFSGLARLLTLDWRRARRAEISKNVQGSPNRVIS